KASSCVAPSSTGTVGTQAASRSSAVNRVGSTYLTPRNIAWTHFPGRRPAGPSRSRQRPSWLPLEWGHAPTGSRSFHDSRWSDAGTRWTRRGPRWRLRAWWLAGALLRRRVRRSYVGLDPAGRGVLVGQED